MNPIKSSKFFLIAAFVLGISLNAMAQENIWSANNNNADSFSKDKAVTRTSFPSEFKLFNLNLGPLRQELMSVADSATHDGTIISLPNADGGMERFEVFEASNFDAKLQAQFPEIRAFSGRGITDRYAILKLSISPQGIQTMVFRTDNLNEFIEPFSDDHSVYAVFRSHREKGELPWACSTEERSMIGEIKSQMPELPESSAGQVKTMRLAQSVTAEYSNFFGATSAAQLSLVLAAINATMTRCNGVYEKDLAVHLNLIPNESAIIYYDPNTDPYSPASSGAGGAWNSELQNNLTATIGAANYDIGHLFGATGGGGNAGCIGCVCVDGSKGSGFTSPADGIPMGDNFDIDYVVHEQGHQMGANHTFSHTLEGTGQNKEVGAGITIMGYAGITSEDPAPHSIDIFHETSIAQIQANLATKTCPVTVNMTANHPPVVTPVGPYTIPISTAFALTGIATDPENDPLTYNWEQNDNATTSGTASVASPTKATGPNWLSFPSTASSTRMFPRLSTILAGLFVTPPLPGGDAICNIEALSSISRTLNFRLTVRDNNPYVPGVKTGQTQFADTVVTVTNTAGPFKVTSPNTNVTWAGGSSQTITWDVANTTAAPVSVANVKISISFDGGQTFPVVLANSTPNDGTETLTIPNTGTTQGRIKIEAVGNIFFDISDANFMITGPTPTPTPTNTFTPTPTPSNTNTGTPSPSPTNTNTNTATNTPTPGQTPCNVTTFSYTGPAVAIPDNAPAGVNFTIPVSGASTISDLNFRFDGTQSADPTSTTPGVNHSWVGDLVVKITSPGGTTVSAFDQPGVPASTFGCNSNNLAQLVLDDDGGLPPVENQCGASTDAAFPTGSFAPNNPLSAFDGQNPNGNWTINIGDNAASDTGSARAFSLVIGSACAGTSTPTSTPTRTSTGTPAATATATATATPTCGAAAWVAGPTQPPGRYAIQGVLGTDNKMYIAGGQSADATPVLSNKLSKFDPVTNTWTDLAPLPVALGQGTVGAANGKIYVAGGFIGGTSVTNALRIYDIATNTWTSGANMPAGVEASAGAVVNGKFYVMGGDDFTNGVTTNYIYDIASNTWTTGAAILDARTNTYGVAVNGLIYVYGGVNIVSGAYVTTDTLLRYDPVANSWTNLGSAGTVGARGNYGAVSAFGSGQLFITDGADASGASSTATHIFNIAGGTFSAGPAMIGPRAGHAQVLLPDGRVIVVDGFNTATTTTANVELLSGGSCATATPTNTATSTNTATPTATTTGTPSGISIQFSSNAYSEDESQVAAITVNRTGSTTGTNTVNFSTTGGTATAGTACGGGVDYVNVTNQAVTFNPGDTSKTVNVTICSDAVADAGETINMTLTGANLGSPSTAVLTINDVASIYRNTGAICTTFGQPASPYPSTITVTNGPASIGSMRVTLFDVLHQTPDSMDFLLVGPTGQKFILMADAGGILNMAAPVTLTFSDSAGQVLPNSAPLTTGVFEPTSWELGQTSFPAPAPPAPYNEPGSAVGGTGTQTLIGNFGTTNGNGTWSLYMRDDAGSFTQAITGCVGGGWGLELFGSTAAGASVSGRVTTADGRGIRNAQVVITGNSLAQPIVATTGSFGYFTFEGLATGETFVVTVNSQRHTFSTPSRVISLVDNIADLDFVADPQD